MQNDWITEVHPLNAEAWQEWVDFRAQEKRIKIGPKAQEKQQKMLCKYPPPIQQSIIDDSIMNSYQGLFEPRARHENTGRPIQGRENTRRLAPHERVRAAAERHARECQGSAVPPVGGYGDYVE